MKLLGALALALMGSGAQVDPLAPLPAAPPPAVRQAPQ